MDKEQWAGEKHPCHVGLYPLGEKDGYRGFIAAEERDRSDKNMWHRLYLGLSTFLGMKGFAHCPDRHGTEMCLQGTREERKTEFQL